MKAALIFAVVLFLVLGWYLAQGSSFLQHRRGAFQAQAALDYVETFDDATDYDLAGWVETGTPLPNTSDPDGGGPFTNECLELDDNPDEVYLPITASGTYNAFTLFRYQGSATDGRAVLEFHDSGGTNLAAVRTRSTDGPVLQAWTSGGTTSNGSFTISADTTYYIWADYTKGTGSDATINVYVSSTGTKPGAADCSSTNGTSTADIARVSLDSGASSFDTLWDDLKIDTNEIGDQ